MLGSDAQQRVREALQKLDLALAEDTARGAEIRKQATRFRDLFFGAFNFIEQEAVQLRELLLKLQRQDVNQLHVLPKGRAHFLLHLDTELAFEHKPHAASRGVTETLQSRTPELSARLFAVFMPPHRGLLRAYTIFLDGSWKRTTYTLFAGKVQAKSTLVPRFNPEMLVMEAIDLVGYACLVHPIWSPMAEEASTFGVEALRDRYRIKSHLIHTAMARREGAVQPQE